MKIEFHPAKDAANLKAHKVSLRAGLAVLSDPRRSPRRLRMRREKQDIERLESRIFEAKFETLKWVIGLALAQMGLILGH